MVKYIFIILKFQYCINSKWRLEMLSFEALYSSVHC